MNAALLATIVIAAFALGYRFYSRFLADKIFALSPDELVPSRELEDGIDYVPARATERHMPRIALSYRVTSHR